jgi:hypothetical protein
LSVGRLLVNSPKKLGKKATLLFGIGLIGTCFLYYTSEPLTVRRRKPLKQVRILILFILKIVSNIQVFLKMFKVGEISVDVCIASNETNSYGIPKTVLFWATFYGANVWSKF